MSHLTFIWKDHPMIGNIDLHTLLENHPALAACTSDIETARELLIAMYSRGGKLLLCGNGGSSADCDHITGELLKGFLSLRPLGEADCQALSSSLAGEKNHPDYPLLSSKLQGALPAISLPAQTALVSAFCNDVDASLVYAQLVWGLGAAGDILLCLSTSGNSRNVVLAAEAARAKGMTVISLTGEHDSALSAISDVTVQAPAHDTYRIQEYHLPIYHYLCAAIESAFFR